MKIKCDTCAVNPICFDGYDCPFREAENAVKKDGADDGEKIDADLWGEISNGGKRPIERWVSR